MPRPTSSILSTSQHRILDCVLRRELLRQPNFISDLVADLGLRNESSLTPTLKRMERIGVLEIQGGGTKGRQRLIVSTEKGRLLSHSQSSSILPFPKLPTPNIRRLPILGSIPAGPLEEVITREDVETLPIDALLRSQPADFLLRIHGDSMIGDGILHGDLVLLRPGVEVHQGEIVAVIATGAGGDCDATLKHLFWQSNGKSVPASQASEVLLRASNPAYSDLLIPAETIRIAGVFRGLIRQSS